MAKGKWPWTAAEVARLTEYRGKGYDVSNIMNMMRKGQLQGMEKGNVEAQVAFVAKLFDVAA